MNNKEQKKIALVTGASKGIGAAIAIDLARSGFDIWLNYRTDTAGAQAVAEKIERLGSSCSLLQFDVSNEDEVKSVLGKALEDKTPYALIKSCGHYP